MPNRIIKESINESEGLSECSLFADDLFKRLITYADDNGRFNADTKLIRARLYPREYDSVTEEDIIGGFIELVGVEKIGFYTADVPNQHGKTRVYGAFPKWGNHQRVRGNQAKCPEPVDTGVNSWFRQRFVSLDVRAQILEQNNFKCSCCGKTVTLCKDAKRFARLGCGLYHVGGVGTGSDESRNDTSVIGTLYCPGCADRRTQIVKYDDIAAFASGDAIFAAERGEAPRDAESRGLNPIQSNPKRIQKESNNTCSNADAVFAEFWAVYPRKVAKKQAQAAFKKVPKSAYDRLVPAVMRQRQTDQWRKNNGQFVPYPATWLNRGSWDDDVEPSRSASYEDGPEDFSL